MLNPEIVKTLANSFHQMKGRLQTLEKDYSQLIEKSNTTSSTQESVEPKLIG